MKVFKVALKSLKNRKFANRKRICKKKKSLQKENVFVKRKRIYKKKKSLQKENVFVKRKSPCKNFALKGKVIRSDPSLDCSMNVTEMRKQQ